MTENEPSRFRVWWVPQVPCPAFHAHVASITEGERLLNTLAAYDAFQLQHNIKPDYCNAGGLEILDRDNEWVAFDPEWDDVADFDIPAGVSDV